MKYLILSFVVWANLLENQATLLHIHAQMDIAVIWAQIHLDGVILDLSINRFKRNILEYYM